MLKTMLFACMLTVSALAFGQNLDNIVASDVVPPPITITKGGEYYTRFTLYYEKNKHITTNYTRGTVLPINSVVTVDSIAKKNLKLVIKETGEKLTIENVEDYTLRSMDEFATLMLSAVPTKVETYGDEMAENIRNGIMKLGMTKQQVILARGYPPRHRTPSTSSNTWTYWQNRFATHTLVFKDDKLVEARGVD